MEKSGNLFGTFKRSLDDKKRLVLPSKLRNQIGSPVFITIGPDQAIEIRSKSSFDSLSKKLLSKNILNKQIRVYQRLLFANTEQLSIDKLGRIVLPTIFLEKAIIKTEVTVIGAGDKIEIWNSDTYRNFEAQNAGQDSLEKLADELYKKGIEL